MSDEQKNVIPKPKIGSDTPTWIDDAIKWAESEDQDLTAKHGGGEFRLLLELLRAEVEYDAGVACGSELRRLAMQDIHTLAPHLLQAAMAQPKKKSNE